MYLQSAVPREGFATEKTCMRPLMVTQSLIKQTHSEPTLLNPIISWEMVVPQIQKRFNDNQHLEFHLEAK